MTIMFRRLKKPTRPMPNSTAPTSSELCSSATSFIRLASSPARARAGSCGDCANCGDNRRRADQGDQQQRAGHFDGDQVPAEQLRAQMGDMFGGQARFDRSWTAVIGAGRRFGRRGKFKLADGDRQNADQHRAGAGGQQALPN